jgi:hypothetical protein
MSQIWQKSYSLASETLSLSIDLLYSSTAEIIESLEESMREPDDPKKQERAAISLRYLAKSEIC